MSRVEIEFVYFDLGNVLVFFDPEKTCRNAAQRFGIETERIREVIYDSGLQDRFEHGQVTGDQYADSVREALGLSATDLPTGALLEAISDMFTPIESMQETVRDAGQSRRTGILSNTCHAHWDWIHRQNWSVMDGGFVANVLSFEVGAMKPDPRIYQAAEQAAGVASESILFLDDRAENVQGAIERGWNAVQCMGGPQAADILRQFGVLP